MSIFTSLFLYLYLKQIKNNKAILANTLKLLLHQEQEHQANKTDNNLISILSSKGSNINVQDTLLIFINDILQIPGGGYIFPGGSIITFTEPPKIGDTSKILFYRGSGSVDVVDVDILETVKIGDGYA